MPYKPRLLIIKEAYWPQGGGSSLATHLILGLIKDSFDIVVITGTKDPKKYNGVSYIYEPLLNTKSRLETWLNNILLLHKQYFTNVLRNSDIVYIPGYSYMLIPLIANIYKKKIVVHFHGYGPIKYIPTCYGLFYRGFITLIDEGISKAVAGFLLTGTVENLLPLLLSFADVFICVSNRQAEIIRGLLPEAFNDRIRVIYNPLPNLPLVNKVNTTSTNLLYPGGFSYRKGFYLLIKALLKTLKNTSDIKIFLGGEYNKKALNMVAKLNKALNHSFYYLSKYDYNDLPTIHAILKGTIIPSISEETFSYATVESMVLGTIPIATNSGGIKEIVSGTYAEKFLFNPCDDNDLVDKILAVASLTKEEIADVQIRLRADILKKIDNNHVRSILIKLFYSLL
jgi:glycosyltransferase involved in cell wall biosynthesis